MIVMKSNPICPRRVAATFPIAFLLLCLAVVSGSAAPKEINLLKQADFSKLKSVAELSAPWQTTAKSAGITVRMVNAKATPPTWVQMKDDSTEAAATMRQSFDAVAKGRFSVYIRANEDHKGGIGVYLGTGTASAPADRVIDIKSSDNGMFRVGSRSERQNTPLVVQPGDVYQLWTDWTPREDGALDVRFGVIDGSGVDRVLLAFVVQEPKPITVLRITTDAPAKGAHFLVSQPRLETR